jgi:hypothetical protein
VGFIPVADQARFLKSLQSLGGAWKNSRQGIYPVTDPFVQAPLFLRFWKNTAFLAMDRTLLQDARTLPEPRNIVPAMRAQDLLAVQLNLDQIPAAFKTAMTGQMVDNPERQVGESKLMHRARRTFMKSFQGLFAVLLTEIWDVFTRPWSPPWRPRKWTSVWRSANRRGEGRWVWWPAYT